MAGLSGVHPELRRRFLAFAAHIRRESQGDVQLVVTSGKRSRRKQEQLYRKAQREGTVAARPGTSLHERGLALDIAFRAPWMRGLSPLPDQDRTGALYGLRRLPEPLRSRDPWHWYPVEFGDRG